MSTVDASPSNNGRGSDAWSRSWTHFSVDRRSPGYCRVTFDHPPINTITATTVAELAELVGLIEEDPDLNVVVFDSANPDFYLAHYDTEDDPGRTAAWASVRPGCTRGSTSSCACRVRRWSASPRSADAPAAPEASSCWPATCASPRARTRCSASSRSERGGPGGGPTARLARLVGRGRALEILLVADDLDGPRAEQYGYVNRAIADDRARRRGRGDRRATRALRPRRDRAHEVPRRPGDAARRQRAPAGPGRFLRDARPALAQQEQCARLEELGLNTDSDLERSLGRRVVESTPES